MSAVIDFNLLLENCLELDTTFKIWISIQNLNLEFKDNAMTSMS